MRKSTTMNQNIVASRQKKRKVSNFSQSPCHKIYYQGLGLCNTISVSEQKWAIATNTLCEKVDPKEAITPSKRRLVLSTHLMQQLLFPAPSSVFLAKNVALNYDTALYFVSRNTLADASSLKCYSDFDKSINGQASKIASNQDRYYTSLVDAFIEKSKKLENDFFQSLEKTTPILDIILQIQDLERFSVINNLSKFHSRAKTITRSIPPLRRGVDIHMPKSLPEPLHCLPL
ncbi:unnamed protein product [Cochlearia groenlandica]